MQVLYCRLRVYLGSRSKSWGVDVSGFLSGKRRQDTARVVECCTAPPALACLTDELLLTMSVFVYACRVGK